MHGELERDTVATLVPATLLKENQCFKFDLVDGASIADELCDET